MATTSLSMASREVNGSAMAALLGEGIGAFAMGAVVLLNEAGLFAAPTLYAPAGGVSGRTTLATIAWLMAWAVLHNRWKGREIAPGRIGAVTLILIAVGVLGTFPPVWHCCNRDESWVPVSCSCRSRSQSREGGGRRVRASGARRRKRGPARAQRAVFH